MKEWTILNQVENLIQFTYGSQLCMASQSSWKRMVAPLPKTLKLLLQLPTSIQNQHPFTLFPDCNIKSRRCPCSLGCHHTLALTRHLLDATRKKLPPWTILCNRFLFLWWEPYLWKREAFLIVCFSTNASTSTITSRFWTFLVDQVLSVFHPSNDNHSRTLRH